jgi:lysophospholipase
LQRLPDRLSLPPGSGGQGERIMDLISIPSNPVPPGAIVGKVRTRDGRTLRFARWPQPPGGRGTVLVAHGRTEFIEKYFELIADLQGRGFAVLTFDWRGQGGSSRDLPDPMKGHVGDFAEYDTDLQTIAREILLPDCPPPHFALGHSMGGAVLLRALRAGVTWFDRTVVAAPMVGLAMLGSFPRVSRATIEAMALTGFAKRYVPGGGPAPVMCRPFEGNPVSSDVVRYERAKAVVEVAPALGTGSPTVGWVHAAFRAMDAFSDPAFPRAIRQPLLIVAAGADRVVATPAIERMARHLRTHAFISVENARHELMMERDRYRDRFLAAFDAFVPGTPVYS